MISSFLIRFGVLMAVLLHSAAPPGIVTDSKLPILRVESFDFAFRGPATARAGYTRVRLVNHGQSPHHSVVTKLPDNATVDWVMKLIAGKVKGKATDAGGPGITPPGDSSEALVDLVPGRYSISCWVAGPDGKPHIMKGMITLVDVARAATPAAPKPVSDLVLRAKDYQLRFDTSPTRGRHIVRFENTGPQEHDVQFVRLRAGETLAAIQKWAEAGMPNAPPVGVLAGGTTGIEPGNRSWFQLDLEPGRYAMFCVVPDKKDDKAHLLHGMLQELVIK